MTAHLLIKSITPPGGQAIEVGSINVLLGPNNVGKSEALRDLARLAGNFDPTGVERVAGEELKTRVLQDVTFVPKLSMDRLLHGLTMYTSQDEGAVALGIAPDLNSAYRRAVPPDLKNVLFRPIITARSVTMTSLGSVMPLRVAYSAADQRSRLVEPTIAISPLRAPENLLQALQYAVPAVHELLDAALATIFDGLHVRLDATERVQLQLRVGASLPPITGDPIADALAQQKLRSFAAEGDGVKSCAAIVLTMLTCQGRAILLDHPEAALQPETARRLGAWIAEHAPKLGCQLFLATRDIGLLTGLFSTATDVTVLRLSRRDDTTRFESVPHEIGKAFVAHPLFAAQNALACLWRDGVVVVAKEADRLVYQTVAERLLRIHNVGFVHAQGSRNLTFVVKALRRANLATCVISDLEVLQSEATFTELVTSLSSQPLPPAWLSTRERLANHIEGLLDKKELSTASNEVENFLEQMKKSPTTASSPATAKSTTAQKWERLRRERLGILPAELRVWVEEMLEDLKRIGLFVSPKGRLAGWISFAADQDDPEGWVNRAMQTFYAGDGPAELRAFVAEIMAHVRASLPAARSARGSNGAT